jgi:Tol biopolymer transport system component
MVCENCGEATDWSPDGKRLIGDNEEGLVWAFEAASHHKTDLLRGGRRGGVGVFSPDNRWCVFLDFATERACVAPLDELPIPESAWIPFVNGLVDPEWYGNLIYSVSDRDGYSCIWAQRLDGVTKRPAGAPLPVFHAHNARISLADTGETYLSIGRDKMLFNMAERTGNIWMAEWKE